MVLRSRLLLASFLFLAFSTSAARAEPVGLTSEFRVISNGGLSTIHFAGSDALFDSSLFVDAPVSQGAFFPNHSTVVGSSANLGSFAHGAELVFRLHVWSTGDNFFTGPTSRNADGAVHAQGSLWSGTSTIPTGGVLVGFEDLFGGGDADFDDYKFVVTNAALVGASPVPEPGTLLLLATGFGAIGRRAWKRRVQGPSAM